MAPLTLRPHQERAVNAVRDCYRRGTRRVLLVAPTGFGKTAVSSKLIEWAVAKGRKVLFTVHRREIVLDTARRLDAAGVPCGVVMAGTPSTSAPVQVASVQTVDARDLTVAADLVVWDEAHHAAAETYRTIAARYPGAWHLGLTATPERADGVGLRDAFDELVVGATVAELQSTIDPSTGFPYLAACDVVGPSRVLKGAELAWPPVEAWQRHAEGRPTVLFARTVADSVRAAQEFCGAGVRAAHIDGTQSKTKRDAILAAFAAGDLDVLTNVYVLTEGWDAPRAKVCVLARGCGSEGTFLQMVGRVLRAHRGERALLIDLAGAWIEHGTPDEERSFTLDGIRRRPKASRPWLRQCVTCGAVVEGARSGPACRRCATPWPAPPPQRIARTDLAPVVRARATREEQRAVLAQLTAVARERGYKAAWAAVEFKRRFGFWPKAREAV